MEKEKQSAATEKLFMKATGRMRFTLTNDYLFRVTLQENEKARRGLISSIMGLEPEGILSVEVTNPIEPGKSIEAKDFIMDTKVLMNNNTMINFEMQVLNQGKWPERSLQYLCRSFDQLNKGQEYLEVRPVIQVCFLDFKLFEEYPEFFSTYMFMNIKKNLIYSDKLKLHVVDLTCIDKATDEDVAKGVERWARLFKAGTWEEIRMLAAENSFLEEAAETAYKLSAEEMIRLQCEAREDFYRQQNYVKKKVEKLKEDNAALQESNAALQESNAALQESNSALQKSNAEKDEEIARLMRIIAEQKRM